MMKFAGKIYIPNNGVYFLTERSRFLLRKGYSVKRTSLPILLVKNEEDELQELFTQVRVDFVKKVNSFLGMEYVKNLLYPLFVAGFGPEERLDDWISELDDETYAIVFEKYFSSADRVRKFRKVFLEEYNRSKRLFVESGYKGTSNHEDIDDCEEDNFSNLR